MFTDWAYLTKIIYFAFLYHSDITTNIIHFSFTMQKKVEPTAVCISKGLKKKQKNKMWISIRSNIKVETWRCHVFYGSYIYAERNQKYNLPADPSQDLLDEISIDTDNVGLSSTENTLTSPTSVSSPHPLQLLQNRSHLEHIPITRQQTKTNNKRGPLYRVYSKNIQGSRESKRSLKKKSDQLKTFFETMEKTVRTFTTSLQMWNQRFTA